MEISPNNQYMNQDGEFIYDRESEPDLISLHCGECESEWGMMPVCPTCGSGAEMWTINSDAAEVLRYYVETNQTDFYTLEKISQMVAE
jgi:hypothetical protein